MKKQYINRRGELVDLDDEDSNIVPDGFGIRTPMFLLDAVQQQIAASTTKARIVDSAGRAAGSRPGFCYDANSNNETQARVAHDLMVARAQSAWRGPNATLISDATTPEASREAYIKHTEQSWRTPVQARDAYGGHVSIPGGDDDDVELARRKYIDGLQNAWRTCKGVGFGPGGFGG